MVLVFWDLIYLSTAELLGTLLTSEDSSELDSPLKKEEVEHGVGRQVFAKWVLSLTGSSINLPLSVWQGKWVGIGALSGSHNW